MAQFKDPDLHTPAHDAIMMWLEANALDIVCSQCRIHELHQEARLKARDGLAKTTLPIHEAAGARELLSAEMPEVEIATYWEVPTNYAGGVRYIDMVISGAWQNPYVEEFNEPDSTGKHRHELCLGKWPGSYLLACEVKPVIRSVGELIRQLRQYEGYTRRVQLKHNDSAMDLRINATLAVVSPDDRFRAIIEKQGFIFIKAPQPDCGPQGGLF